MPQSSTDHSLYNLMWPPIFADQARSVYTHIGHAYGEKMRTVSFSLLLSTIGCLPALVAQSTAATQIYARVAPSVVLIEMYSDSGEAIRSGSGFIASSDGKIVTNHHVIEHSRKGTVKLANGDVFDIKDVYEIDKRRDLALISIRGVDLPALKFSRSSEVEIGHTVYTISNPLGKFENTLSQGIVSSRRQIEGTQLSKSLLQSARAALEPPC